MRVLIYSLFVLFILLSCEDRVSKVSPLQSDTTKILQLAIQQGISEAYMPSATPLKRKYKFGDSILLSSDVLPLNLLPTSIGKQPFKIMTQEQICTLIKQDSTSPEVPNYLLVSRFEKDDSSYHVQMKSLSCLPFGGGGILGLYFKKEKDSFLILNNGAASIN